ncbi:helix-turn-helix domain-containing protein [Catenulispora pinisilvae]|uniref:helix-turn-helix domain-containing protein n=1 Tax=Catenulispora pinisilvae TaxID=2705253 RepID=UPI003F6A3CDF
MLADEVGVEEVARRLRVSVRSVDRWRAAFDRAARGRWSVAGSTSPTAPAPPHV